MKTVENHGKKKKQFFIESQKNSQKNTFEMTLIICENGKESKSTFLPFDDIKLQNRS